MIGAVRKSRASRSTECVGGVEGLSIAPKSVHSWARTMPLCRCMMVIREMSESPELELIYGALAEISDRLEKINKNLERLNALIDTYLTVKFDLGV